MNSLEHHKKQRVVVVQDQAAPACPSATVTKQQPQQQQQLQHRSPNAALQKLALLRLDINRDYARVCTALDEIPVPLFDGRLAIAVAHSSSFISSRTATHSSQHLALPAPPAAGYPSQQQSGGWSSLAALSQNSDALQLKATQQHLLHSHTGSGGSRVQSVLLFPEAATAAPLSTLPPPRVRFSPAPSFLPTAHWLHACTPASSLPC